MNIKHTNSRSISLREKFVPAYAEELKQADAVFFSSTGQDRTGLAQVRGGSEGILYLKLETSGTRWGRGPTEFGIHGALKLIVDSPTWRHIKMLSTLVFDDGNKILVDGWYDDVEPPGQKDLNLIKDAAKYFDPEQLKETLKFNVFIDDVEDPEEILKLQLFGTSFCLDGIWGGWTGPGTKTLITHKATSKHTYASYRTRR